jgi:hypothetical protein
MRATRDAVVTKTPAPKSARPNRAPNPAAARSTYLSPIIPTPNPKFLIANTGLENPPTPFVPAPYNFLIANRLQFFSFFRNPSNPQFRGAHPC